jgi:hypothetical protein
LVVPVAQAGLVAL